MEVKKQKKENGRGKWIAFTIVSGAVVLVKFGAKLAVGKGIVEMIKGFFS
ncbi:hypothetical protein ACFDTO_26815 [Microbacteriaceae bacterium 4G12]